MTIDSYDIPPTVLASRIFPGIIPSTSYGNVAWNEDGQCLFVTKKGVNIVTPHLTTTFSPPPTLVDPSLTLENPSSVINESKRRAASASAFVVDDNNLSDEDGLDNYDETPLPSGGARDKGKGKEVRMRRPKKGEIKFWNTGMEVDKDRSRDEVYGWDDVGDEITAIVSEKEVTTRQAIWSPSGLNDLGGSLLVVLNTNMQVSVYAPRNDPYTKQWDEIADLTSIIWGSIPPESLVNGLTVEAMCEMRTMCMQWSTHLPLTTMIGIDGSLLVLGNRAGKISFWSYGAEKRFCQIQSVRIVEQGGWVTDMAWSEWKTLGDHTCEAHLALTLTDGSVRVVSVQRKAEIDPSHPKAWSLDVQPALMIDRGDERHIGSIKWIDDVLVWTKSGSVHIFAPEGNQTVQWNGIVSLKLERVGNWAGANGIGPCIGISRINRDTLVIVLSSLTTYIIADFTTSPTLAHPHDSLRTALALRDMFEDHLLVDPLIRIRFRGVELQPEGWTANTSGWTGLGWGGIGAWVTEPISFHNLDNATEGKRSMTFVLGHIGKAGPTPDKAVIEALRGVLTDPPNLLHQSSGKVLMPYLLHILSLKEPETLEEELLDLTLSISSIGSAAQQHKVDLVLGFWDQKTLDQLRLAMVLASWCEEYFPASATRFQQVTASLSTSITARLVEVLLSWSVTTIQRQGVGNLDRQFIHQLLKTAQQLSTEHVGPELPRLIQDISSKLGHDEEQQDAEERCPACKTEVGSDGTCVKGHVWTRCSTTHLLITHPHYRVCSTCPAISLLPKRHLSTPIPVDDQGRDHDYQRFIPSQRAEEDSLIQVALEAAIACLNCGGRWQRAV
ncbi:hypothetical protein I302_105897 [Kwoniella bestiolae CBS 10118]|uniref:Transcription factor IIIC 90kDa subunit N-terminal domain-containing protein n=1 Tax=Kwoniella bestiolae CBS 10118 TaxID=1296100 RepID=A0A1B9G2G1_9TREE|nr:hypothetical protein I302_05022 [Kwoniella bestiolae CBS 10118]OCF25209.1 hypothetical protein I302_05022 [Kwoniella bestiolae CBS 10118]